MLNKILASRIPAARVEQLKESLIQLIRDRSNPAAVYIFGSACRGEMTTSSDIDVACIFKSEQEAKMGRKQLRGLSSALGWPVDLLIYVEDNFHKQANIGGVCEVIRDSGCKVW